MSETLTNKQIRTFEPIGNPILTLGAAAQQVSWDIVLSKKTDLIEFGLSETVSTVPANDPLTGVWATAISITINGTHEIVRNMTLAEYIAVVQNLESKTANLISNGNMLTKRFKPALPAKTRIQVNIIVNTLALATTTPAATFVCRPLLSVYDTNMEAGNSVQFYQPIPAFPQPVGVVANAPIQQDLGVESKIVRMLVLREFVAAALSDTITGRIELLIDGNPIARINESLAKKQYFQLSDDIAVPVGYKAMKLPGPGWNASKATNCFLRITPHTTSATGQYDGWQILRKNFV